MATAPRQLADDETARWDDYVAGHPQASLFHSIRWSQLLERVYGCQRRYLLAEDGDGVRGILPLVRCGAWYGGHALVALPYAGTQPSVCATDGATAAALVDHAVRLARAEGVSCVELREAAEQPWPLPATSTYVNIKLPLSADPEEVWSTRLDSRVRTKVRAARKRGLAVVWRGADGVDAFFDIYAETMHRLGSPPHAKALFRELFALFPDNSRMLLVMDGQRTVAGAVVMYDARWIGFPWAASRTDAMAKHPNNLLYWHIIELACARGHAHLDLGRSLRSSGTEHFKLQWGGTATPLWYYFGLARARRLPRRDASDRLMILSSQVWRRLPRALADAAGPALARLIP